jgi:hypothetical protein
MTSTSHWIALDPGQNPLQHPHQRRMQHLEAPLPRAAGLEAVTTQRSKSSRRCTAVSAPSTAAAVKFKAATSCWSAGAKPCLATCTLLSRAKSSCKIHNSRFAVHGCLGQCAWVQFVHHAKGGHIVITFNTPIARLVVPLQGLLSRLARRLVPLQQRLCTRLRSKLSNFLTTIAGRSCALPCSLQLLVEFIPSLPAFYKCNDMDRPCKTTQCVVSAQFCLQYCHFILRGCSL